MSVEIRADADVMAVTVEEIMVMRSLPIQCRPPAAYISIGSNLLMILMEINHSHHYSTHRKHKTVTFQKWKRHISMIYHLLLSNVYW